MKSKFALTALALFAVAPSAALAQAAPPAVVVVIDSERIYRECNACKTAQSGLQSRINTLRTRQQTLTNQLRTESQAIETAIRALNGAQPDAALRTRANAFQKKQDDANQELARGQENIQSIQQNVLRQINARLLPAIREVMSARGANMAVDTSNLLAHAAGVDVTTPVLTSLNRTLTSVSLTPLPAQTPAAQPAGR
jgi:outer membrane protein